ncbi:MAG: cyanophycinase [Gemmatimonadaceae bacterium]
MSPSPDIGGRPEPASRAPGRRRSDERSGTLVLIGGACDPRGPAFGAFLDLTGARDGGRIVGFTTASADPTGAALQWKNDFQTAGARNVELPIVDRRDRAQDTRIADMVMKARGIFLGGGDQVVLVATLGGSRVGRAIREAFFRGAVVCGTSAGAAALSETVLAGGEMDENGEPVELHTGPGLGLLDFSSVIDTHFSKRGRLQRLFRHVAENPELLGLGIDEDTALVVRGALADVVGRGSVIYVDGRGVRFDNAEEMKHRGAPLTLSYLRVGIVGAGYTFNLRERELEILVQSKERGEQTPTVKGEGAE